MNKSTHALYLTLTFLVAALSTTAVVASEQSTQYKKISTAMIGLAGAAATGTLLIVADIQNEASAFIYNRNASPMNLFKYVNPLKSTSRATLIVSLGTAAFTATKIKEFLDLYDETDLQTPIIEK